ncbi:MAG: SDR family oxidoreductase [Chitinophagaceae bacterium]
MENIALVVGSTGIAGSNLATRLLEKGWTSYGLSRHNNNGIPGLKHITGDLLQADQLKSVLEKIRPTHVFITTWMRNNTEAENIRVNGAMVRNLLNALSPGKSVQHVALVTGLKHYLGPFDAYAKDGTNPETPVREEHPRLELENFYYAQEDEVYAAAARDGFTWSIHRPHTIIGKTVGNAMNLGTTLAVYGSLCKEYGFPFAWPGSQAQWEGLSDVTDAEILADQLIWAAITPRAHNEAFNIVNGDVFRWKWLWKEIAAWFDIKPVGYDGTIRPLASHLDDRADLWNEIVAKYHLKKHTLGQLTSAWHTDLDLGRPIEIMTDMSKSRKLGFLEYRSTKDSFIRLFQQLRTERIIP